MMQEDLWHEDIYDALHATVKRLGKKNVAEKLRPSKTLYQAQTWLDNAIDPNRSEKLDPSEFILLMKWAASKGCHILANYICQECPYELKIVQKQEQVNELQQELVTVVSKADEISKRLERILTDGAAQAS